MKPLQSFITRRELEPLLPALVAHLKPAEERSELRFTEAAVASLGFPCEGKRCMAHIGLWESGDCDVEIVDIASGAFHPSGTSVARRRKSFITCFAV
jgi:hypothetical protein